MLNIRPNKCYLTVGVKNIDYGSYSCRFYTVFNVTSKIISGIVSAKNKTLTRNRSLSKRCIPKIQEY